MNIAPRSPMVRRQATGLSWSAAIGLVLSCALFPIASGAQEPVMFETADGIEIFGHYWAPPSSDAPVVLLFHQGGASGLAEYESIVPRLLGAGFGALAIDQRRGGDRFGGTNRTAAAVGGEPSYCSAYPDLEAALQFVRDQGHTGARVVWGSSYSAALALQLASNHGEELAAVLAFSPATGAAMGQCGANQYAGSIAIPSLVLRPENEAAIPSVREQLDHFRAAGHEVYVAVPGTHGSSMLVDDRVDGPTGETWSVVLGFLRRVTEGR